MQSFLRSCGQIFLVTFTVLFCLTGCVNIPKRIPTKVIPKELAAFSYESRMALYKSHYIDRNGSDLVIDGRTYQNHSIALYIDDCAVCREVGIRQDVNEEWDVWAQVFGVVGLVGLTTALSPNPSSANYVSLGVGVAGILPWLAHRFYFKPRHRDEVVNLFNSCLATTLDVKP